MSGIDRYSLFNGVFGEPKEDWDEDGKWVLFTDHEAEVSGLLALVARMVEELQHRIDEAEPLSGDPRAPLPGWVDRARALLADPSVTAATAWLAKRQSYLRAGLASYYSLLLEHGWQPSLEAPDSLDWLAAQKREAVREALNAVRVKVASFGLGTEPAEHPEPLDLAIAEVLAALAAEATKGEELDPIEEGGEQ